jgi:hypothetical protein
VKRLEGSAGSVLSRECLASSQETMLGGRDLRMPEDQTNVTINSVLVLLNEVLLPINASRSNVTI